MEFLDELYTRNSFLYIFGWICLAGVGFTSMMILITDQTVLGINAWIKPFKFFLSSAFFVWSMAWYTGYLDKTGALAAYNWVVIIVLAFELIYISLQASKGQLSHFNISTMYHSVMYSLMGAAISIMTLFTAYIGLLFFIQSFPDLPPSYLWGIRLGILFFVIFAFEGGLMAAKLAHTVGAVDGGQGIKFLNWSLSNGDLRIAHFAGMHALQLLPLLGFYVLTSQRHLLIFSLMFFLMVSGILIQALLGHPLIRKI